MKHTDEISLNFSVDTPEVADPEMPESFEDATKEEINQVLSEFRMMAKKEAEMKANNVSTEYWFAVYFANQEHRDMFLRAINLLEKMEDQYIDGMTFSKAVGVNIPNNEITTPKSFRRPANIDDLVLEL